MNPRSPTLPGACNILLFFAHGFCHNTGSAGRTIGDNPNLPTLACTEMDKANHSAQDEEGGLLRKGRVQAVRVVVASC